VFKDLSILHRKLTYNDTQRVTAATLTGPTALHLTEQDPAEAGEGPETVKTKPSKVTLAVLGGFLIFNLFLVFHCSNKERFADHKNHDLFNLNDNGKVYVYNNERLLTWRILLTNTPALVLSWRVWIVVPCVHLLAYGSALMVVCKFSYASGLETARIEKFGTYLRVFISFMLGLYMNNSFGRWHNSVTNFRLVLTSIKQLMFQVRVMKLPQELTSDVQRKCLIACYILDAEVRTDLSCKASACKDHWDGIWTSLEEKKLLTKAEAHSIRKRREGQLDMDMGGHSTMIWAWIGHVVSTIKEAPGVSAPMYVRCVSILHACIGQVDQLKQCVHVQVPFTYAYLLSTIVHLNNIILAVCTGLHIGSSLSDVSAEKGDSEKATSLLSMLLHRLEPVSTATAGIETLILLIQPLMYQACLAIAHLLNHPFGDEVFHLPTQMFILLLQDELTASGDSFARQGHSYVSEKIDSEDEAYKEENDDDQVDVDGDADCH